MANSPMHVMHNIEENIKKYRWVIIHLRETRRKQGKELFDLDNKIRSANNILTQDPFRELLFKSMPPLKNYDYDPEKVFYLNTYDYSYSNVIEKVLGPASEIHDKLVKGLTDLTISTTAGLERYSYPKNTNFD
jgi:hypothetical protein